MGAAAAKSLGFDAEFVKEVQQTTQRQPASLRVRVQGLAPPAPYTFFWSPCVVGSLCTRRTPTAEAEDGFAASTRSADRGREPLQMHGKALTGLVVQKAHWQVVQANQ